MKRIIFVTIFFFIFTSFPSLNAQWAIAYGGSDLDFANSIQQTSDGGYIVAGSTLSFGAGSVDIWVLKLSSTGTIDWQKTYGGSDLEYVWSIQQTSDGGYIVAGYTSPFGAGSEDIWVLKLSSTGTIDWQRTYGGSDNENAHSIQQTSDGGYIVAGITRSFGAGGPDAWILKLSSTGTIDWQRTYGGSDLDDAHSIQQTSDGGNIIAGYTYSFGAGSGDIWVLELFSDGDIDPSCGFIGTSNASVLSTSISPVDTNITHEDTFVTPLVTNVSPQDTDATVMLLCEASQDDGGGGDDGDDEGGGGGCFIATAAYGSPYHPYVEVMRDFRDEYLMDNKIGREFVDIYYKYSPFVANIVAKHKPLRVIVQINLTPFVVFSYSMVHFGPMVTGRILLLILVIPVFFIYVSRRM